MMSDGGETFDRIKPLSLAYVSPGWPPNAFANGIIPYVANIADEMRNAGHRATVVPLQVKAVDDSENVRIADPGRYQRSAIEKIMDSVAYRLMPKRSLEHQSLRPLIAVCRQLIAEKQLDLVEIEESHGWARLLQRSLPIPVIVRLHGPWFLNGPLQGAVDDEKFRRRVEAERQAISSATAITSSSQDVLDRTRAYYGIPLEQARVIHPPTTMIPSEDRWNIETAEADSIVFVGRFDRHKGGDLVIDAFVEVARRKPEAKLIFIGPDYGYHDDNGRRWSIQEYLRERVADEGIASRIHWRGAQPSDLLAGFRRKAGVVVVGSRYDNFPVTVLEAMAVGSPLVAPRIGGIPEIVADGVNGLLFKMGDTSDMASKLVTVLEDRELAARLGARAAIDCERLHHPAFLARKIAGFYDEVLASRGRSRKGEPPCP